MASTDAKRVKIQSVCHFDLSVIGSIFCALFYFALFLSIAESFTLKFGLMVASVALNGVQYQICVQSLRIL